MWRNPVVTAVLGLLVGFFVGYVVAQGQPAAHPERAASDATNPHAGVPGAPQLSGQPAVPPAGGRTSATANPQLMEQERELGKLIEKDPRNYEHLVQMGNVLYDMNNYLKAREYYERARAIKDDSADVLTDLGVCYRETNEPKKALELFDHAADMKGEHWQSRYNAAVVRLFDLNDVKGAQEELAKLKKLKGNNTSMPELAGLEQEIAKRQK